MREYHSVELMDALFLGHRKERDSETEARFSDNLHLQDTEVHQDNCRRLDIALRKLMVVHFSATE